MNVDRGTCVTVGLTDAAFELLNGYYLRFEENADDVTPVVRRAMSEIEGGIRRTGERPAEPAAAVDVLADVAEVMRGERRVRTQTVLARLAELNTLHYEGWTFGDLRAALVDHGVEPVKSDGVMVVRAGDITAALNERRTGE